MTRERWGASKWVRGQLRVWAVNPYNRDEADKGFANTVSHEAFMKVIDPIWHQNFDDESKLAILKRSCIILVSNDWCYWRIAGERRCDVNRVRLNPLATGMSDVLCTPAVIPL